MALVRAIALKDFRTNPLSTTDVTTGYNITGPSATQSLYAGLHLTSASLGTTARMLVMTVQGATASAFGSPTTGISFLLSTAQGAEWGVPITGAALRASSTLLTWWRANWTLSTAASTGGLWKGVTWFGIK